LVVDGEGGDLLDQLQEVDGGVEEGRGEFLLEVWVRVFGLDALYVLGDVDEGGDVDGELAEDGADDVGVKDVVLRALFGQSFDGLVILLVHDIESLVRLNLPLRGRWIRSKRSSSFPKS
jgi:hypothetical protein